MIRLAICVLGLCVAFASQQSVAQFQCNMCDAGCGQVSPCAGSPCADGCCGTQPQCGQSGAFFNQCDAGGCGTIGNRIRGIGGGRGAAGGCGADQGCCSDVGCGGGGRGGLGTGRVGQVGQRAVSLMPSSILGRVLDRRCGCPCSKYRKFFAGGVSLDNYDGTATGGGGGGNQIIGTFRDGFIVGTAAGRYINANLHGEWETNWRNNSGDVWTNLGMNNSVPFDGHFNTFSNMFNLIRDFPFDDCPLLTNSLLRNCPLVFYCGGGIGFTKQDGGFVVNNNFFQLTDWAFAYQAIFGCNFWECQRGKLFAEYRYFGNTETELRVNGAFFDTFNYVSNEVAFGITLKRK